MSYISISVYNPLPGGIEINDKHYLQTKQPELQIL